MKSKIFLLIFLFLPTSFLNAQESDELVRPNKDGKITIRFEDELVKGATALPDGEFIQNRVENKFKRFIKIRKDFIRDVENTKDEFGNR